MSKERTNNSTLKITKLVEKINGDTDANIMATLSDIGQQALKSISEVNSTKSGDRIFDLSPDKQASPNEMKFKNELYKLIEKYFASMGGGTGDKIKTDKRNEDFYNQLFIVDEKNNIQGGYRYAIINKEEIKSKRGLDSAMTHFFNFNDKFKIILQNNKTVLELGTARAKDLSKVWLGLGHIFKHKEFDALMGKLTIPTNKHYPTKAADFFIYYLETYYKKDNYMVPKNAYQGFKGENKEEFDMIFKEEAFTGKFEEDKKIINKILRSYGVTGGRLPGMRDMYAKILNDFDNINYSGTIVNGDVLECGILVEKENIEKNRIDRFSRSLER